MSAYVLSSVSFIIVLINLVYKRKSSLELVKCPWISSNFKTAFTILMVSHSSSIPAIGPINANSLIHNKPRNLLLSIFILQPGFLRI